VRVSGAGRAVEQPSMELVNEDRTLDDEPPKTENCLRPDVSLQR